MVRLYSSSSLDGKETVIIKGWHDQHPEKRLSIEKDFSKDRILVLVIFLISAFSGMYFALNMNTSSLYFKTLGGILVALLVSVGLLVLASAVISAVLSFVNRKVKTITTTKNYDFEKITKEFPYEQLKKWVELNIEIAELKEKIQVFEKALIKRDTVLKNDLRTAIVNVKNQIEFCNNEAKTIYNTEMKKIADKKDAEEAEKLRLVAERLRIKEAKLTEEKDREEKIAEYKALKELSKMNEAA